MRKLFTLRSLLSWFILLVAMSALIAGIKEGVLNVQNAAFFPVAAFVMTLAYILGFSTWSARHMWSILLVSGVLVAFIETTKLVEPLRNILRSIPQFELGFVRYFFELIRWLFEKENIEAKKTFMIKCHSGRIWQFNGSIDLNNVDYDAQEKVRPNFPMTLNTDDSRLLNQILEKAGLIKK